MTTLAEHKAAAIDRVKLAMKQYRKGIISLGELYQEVGKALVAYEQTIANTDQGPDNPTIWTDASETVLRDAGWTY